MQTFNENELVAHLGGVSSVSQSAFAQACAVRISSLGEVALSATVLDLRARALLAAQDFVKGGQIDRSALDSLIGEFDVSEELDDDRVASVAYVVRHLISADPQEAVWAAQRAYEACDQHAQSELEFDFFTAEVEQVLRSHPLVQAELECQVSDVSVLLDEPLSAVKVIQRAHPHRV